MNEKFILNVFDKFEKSSAVLLHIKEGEAELTLKKEAAYQNIPAAQAGTCANSFALPVPGAGVPVPPGQAAFPNTAMTNTAAVAGTVAAAQTAEMASAGMAATAAGTAGVNPAGAAGASNAGVAANANLVTVKSPIVGSFYRSPSPDAPAYVDKGSKVSKGQPLCILEAMKMMNTLECEYDGIIEEILAANGDLVEFDQPLFVIRV